jgi:hypothetical protein
MNLLAGGVAGLGFIFLAIAAVLIWKDSAPRMVAWLILFGSGMASAILLPWLSIIFSMSLFGIPAAVVIDVIGGLTFYLEVLRKKGHHWIRTPIIAGLLGVSLAITGGTVGNLFHSAINQTTQTVDHTANLGG